jgi:hypothetical protein
MAEGSSLESAQLNYSLMGLLIGLVGLLISVVIYTAAQRSVLRPDEGGPGWLRLGMDEVRQFLLFLLYIVIFSVGAALFGLIVGSTAMDNMVLPIVFGLAGFFVLFALGVKVSLGFPLTLKRKAFAVGEGWRMTEGHFWTLFIAYFIIFLIVMAISILTIVITQPDYIAAVATHGPLSAEAEQASTIQFERLMLGTLDAPVIIGWLLSAVGGTIACALGAGSAATAVQQLDGAEEGLSETFS